jgi:hypothetical protein
MRLRSGATTALAVGLLGVAATAAVADRDDDGQNRQAIDTRADYTPFERFTPLAESSNCPGEGSGKQANPYNLPAGGTEGPDRYDQAIVFEESDPVTPQPPQGSQPFAEDLFDMNTQNEFGKDAGRYVFRTHEVGAATEPSDPQSVGGSQVTVTDLKTGETKNLADRNDWERFDGIVWTPQGTILAAEETSAASGRDPQVTQANAGLVYELFVDKDDPSRLDPSRERITRGDGTTDTVRDGIRARPALGSKSHEGMRFDKRGFLYGIAETRGENQTATQSGGIFRFVPDRKGDLSRGQLSAYDSPNRKDGAGRWQDLDRTAVQVDADAEAARRDVNRYQRPEDVETGESTGKDKNNGGQTLYVGITEDGSDGSSEEGAFAIDVRQKDRPFGYRYVGKQTGTIANPRPGNASEATGFNTPDNLALDRKGNLAIAEDGGGNGDDVFIAAPPRGSDDDDDNGKRRDDDDNGKRREPARTVQRFASIRDCAAEGTGIYFALQGTERFSRSHPNPEVRKLVNGETLFVNRQHAGQTSPVDQLVAIAPVEDDENDDDGEDDDG